MKKRGFSLFDVLLAMIIVGTIFTLIVPSLYQDSYKNHVSGSLIKFNSTMQNAIDKWKAENYCPYKFGVCLVYQKRFSSQNPDFNQLKKYLNIARKIDRSGADINLLPEKTLNYYGTGISEYDFRRRNNRDIYMFLDGAIFSVESDEQGFWLLVDVNGHKPPNRIGKDTFHLTLGYNTGNDINFYAREKTQDGICGHGIGEEIIKCNPANLNPLVDNGASPAAYIIINKKLPDFEALSKIVPKFKP